MDQNETALTSLEDFRATRVEMPAHAFGDLVSDAQWEGDDTPFLVYADCYWIEKLDDGRHMVTIENDGGITGEGVTLEDLEEKLYDWARASNDPIEDLPSGP
ncbi:MAG: hypothetical protein ABJN42_13630 [Roseibium sp.]|uniref:hypothetical protein n=1 Tax=Alphaproteobacteria TaxID=28211 RepID=UPI003298FB78